jgi:hypothetical protein
MRQAFLPLLVSRPTAIVALSVSFYLLHSKDYLVGQETNKGSNLKIFSLLLPLPRAQNFSRCWSPDQQLSRASNLFLLIALKRLACWSGFAVGKPLATDGDQQGT